MYLCYTYFVRYLVSCSLIFSLFASVLVHGVLASSAYVQTNTTVEGSGSVTTHMQTTVNGQTKTLDTTDQGEHTVEIQNNDDSNEMENTGEEPITVTPAPIVTPYLVHIQATSSSHRIVEQKHMVVNFIHSFLSALKHFFHFS